MKSRQPVRAPVHTKGREVLWLRTTLLRGIPRKVRVLNRGDWAMNAYEKEYEVLSNRAKCTRKSWGYREQEANANDQTQQTFLRYFEKGFESKLDPSKGSAGTLLGGIFRLISKESSRAHGREATLPESVSVTLKDHSIGLLDALIEKEQRNFLFGCLPQLTEREQLALARYLAPERSRLLPSDYVAKHRAIKKLRLWAREKGLLDNE